jgi:hypothetical protein
MHRHRLAIGVTILASVVGGVVGAAAANAGAGECHGPDLGVSSADLMCTHLVATLSQRVGLATAAATAIIVLTFMGLSRLAERGRGT